MYKVAIIGPESTGKSTLAKYLAKRYHGIYVEEYARTYVEQRGTTDLSYDEICSIARHQIAQLQTPIPSSPFRGNEGGFESSLYIYDTDLIVTKIWLLYAFGSVPSWLDEAIRTYPMDTYLLTSPDLPWIPDPARSNGSDAIRLDLFHRYESEIQSLNIPYYIIRHTS